MNNYQNNYIYNLKKNIIDFQNFIINIMKFNLYDNTIIVYTEKNLLSCKIYKYKFKLKQNIIVFIKYKM